VSPGGDEGQKPPPPEPEAPGLFEQIKATRDAAKQLVKSHVELAKAEFADITDAIKRAAILVGVAIAAGIFAGLLVAVGTPLFLGEWLFGSIGWGILLGLVLMLAIAVAAGVMTLDTRKSWGVGKPFLAGLVVGIAVGVLLGLDLTNRGWTMAGDAVAPGIYGSSPNLSSLDSNGNLLIENDFRSYYGTILADWLKADSAAILGAGWPNLGFLNKAYA